MASLDGAARRSRSAPAGLWIGWPGDLSAVRSDARAEVDARLAERRTLPVRLTPDEVKRYYNGFANGVIWPLFHYQLDRIPLTRATGMRTVR